MRTPGSVLQDWVLNLTFMQQSVLISAMRGPDAVKNDAEKAIKRWLRRSVLYSAFETAKAGVPTRLNSPTALGGGSFTGPLPERFNSLDDAERAYIAALDTFPHHYIMHMIGAVEIVGYKHDLLNVRALWHAFYLRLVRKTHLHPETEEEMDQRLGDSEERWAKTEK